MRSRRLELARGRRAAREAVPEAPVSAEARWGVLELFVIAQTALPALLFVPGTQAIRTPLRVAPFALSLALLAWGALRGSAGRAAHPARPMLTLAVVVLAVMIVHPETNGVIGGIASIGVYLSVMAPVFWVPAFVRDARQLKRILAVLLVCNGLNAGVGVLQAYDPATWMPPEFSRIVANHEFGLDALSYVGRDGFRVVRPPGLFDTPGAVCMPGMTAAVLGLVFFLSPIRRWHGLAALTLALAGAVAIYLSYVRTTALVVVGVAVVYIGTLVVQKRTSAAAAYGTVLAAVVAAALVLAATLGGDSVLERFSTIVERDPLSFYFEAGRGPQLETHFVDFLGDYPLGAGLARWGMVSLYFGENRHENAAIWVELMPNAWLIDGGIALLLLYSLALFATVRHELRLVRSATDPDVRQWGPVILALNAGIVGLVLGGTPFVSQGGMQYWFLAGLLHAVAAAVPAPTPAADAKRRPR